MRHPQDGRPDTNVPAYRPYRRPAPQRSATPIYDALCAEYQRLFRALPGDRSGEENLHFQGFDPVHGLGAVRDEPSVGPSRRHVLALPPAPRDGDGYRH